MEKNVFCFFRNVRREIYLGIGSLSVSCIGKYTFNHYIFHCSLVAIAKGNYFSSCSVLPTFDTVLRNQIKCKLVTLILTHFPSSNYPSVWKFQNHTTTYFYMKLILAKCRVSKIRILAISEALNFEF